MHVRENKTVIKIGPKTFYFGLPKDADKIVEAWNWSYHKTKWIFSWAYNKKQD